MLWVRIPLREGVLDITLCDTVCQWLTAGRWFSLDTPVSSTNKTYCHDITKILLKVALNTITLTLRLSDFDMCCSGKCLGKISRRRYWGNVVEKESFMASLRKWSEMMTGPWSIISHITHSPPTNHIPSPHDSWLICYGSSKWSAKALSVYMYVEGHASTFWEMPWNFLFQLRYLNIFS
jgi:hypothetical protein